MSGEAASSKQNISGEAASSKKSKTADGALSKKTMSEQSTSSSYALFLDELQVGVTETITVMLCRIWDASVVRSRYLSTDLVVSDAMVISFIALQEQALRIILSSLKLEFDGSTTVRKSLAKADGFVRHPFKLVDFNSIIPTNGKYLIDVAGYITNVGRSIQQRTGSRTLDFYLANQRGQTLRVTLWGGLGDVLIEKKTNSSTLIFDDADIPALKELRSENSGMELTKEVMPVEYSESREGTLENLLMWARNQRND
ncbi:replication protein A 70 kDa DNA-binding subunit C-like protein, partial [Tanacetum coccineum]